MEKKEESKHEQIMAIVLDALGDTIENLHCANAETAINVLCYREYENDYPLMFQYALENMSVEQFNRIKELSE